MKIETEDGIVRLEQDVATVFTGWSKRIQPKVPFSDGWQDKQTLWLNTYLDFWKRDDN